jgi:hypothetical protein
LHRPVKDSEPRIYLEKGSIIQSAPTLELAARQRLLWQRLKRWNRDAAGLRTLSRLGMTARRNQQQQNREQSTRDERTASKHSL